MMGNRHEIKMIILPLAAAIALLAVCCNNLSAENELASHRAQSYLSRAEKAFREGLELDATDPEKASDSFQESILYYRELIEKGGIRNGRIFYNIGNAYFRMGELGRAILNYKRAALYMPNNENLRQNLEYARSRRLNKIEERDKEKIFKTLFFLHYDLSFELRFLLFTAGFALVWITAIVMIFIRTGILKTALILFSVITVVFLGSVATEIFSSRGAREGVITMESVMARKGDAKSYQPSFTEPLREGTEFSLLEERGGWYHIELVNGERCWIPSRSAETVLE
jgi:hypothetical protein